MSFTEDLEFGRIYEKKLLDHVECESYIIKDMYFKEYDVETFDTLKNTIRYEVKADRMSYKSHNIVIEFECSNIPSGISTTTAHYYAYFSVRPYDLYDLYIIPVSILKKLIRKNKYKRIIAGGDNKASRMYLFDMHTFDDYKLNF